MKKCMSGCGGKMSKGGKVTPKKMANGGALKPLGAKIGVGVNLAGMLGTGVKMIVDKIKEKNAKKKVVTEKNVSTSEDVKRRGGAKYKTGGIAEQTIVAFPGYNARTDTMKKGGATKNAKLAALAAPKNKITRADVIAGAIKNKRKRS